MTKKLTLDNGLTIITEYMPQTYSTAVMAWINVGTEIETESNNGISHFAEHMIFKGTTSRSAKKIVEDIENTGGSINALTQKDCTCLYTKVLGEHASLAIDTLLDMIFNSTFDQKDINLERKVILDEIKMYEDSPEELVYDLMLQSFFNNNPLGYSITGTTESILNISRKDLIDFAAKYYVPNNIIISIAGNFQENEVIEQIKSIVASKKSVNIQKENLSGVITPVIKTLDKEIEQTHMCLGLEGLSIYSPERYALAIIDTCLGGGMSSRLFQNIREEKGLAYCIDTFEESFKPFGVFGVYAGLNPQNTQEVINLILKEFNELRVNGFGEDEIEKAKANVKGNLLIGLDTPKKRAARNARSELYFNKILSIEEICNKINDISKNDVDNLCKNLFNVDNVGITLVGPDVSKIKKYSFV